MQCTRYCPGYHPKDLNGSLSSNSRSIQHNDIAWNSARGFYVSLPPVMADQNLESVHQKEILKQTILKHEAIFRNQVNELHRIYRRQRVLMEEIRSSKLVENHLHLQALESKSFVSQLRSEISQKSHCPHFLDLTNIEPSTLCGETFQGCLNSTTGQRVPPGADLLAEQNVSKERKISSSKSSASRKRMLDLELPAEEYIDIEDGEQFVRESHVQGPNILISELQPQHSSKVNFVNPGDSSISNSSPRGSFLLFDLNEPMQLDETGYTNSAHESVNIHGEISNMDQDLSGTVHAKCSTPKKEVTGGDISNMNSSDEVSSVEITLLQCNQTASSSPRFVDKSHNGTKTDKLLLISSRKKIKEIPFAVQALPCFITNASPNKSPNSSLGNSSLTGKKSDLFNSRASSPASGTSGSCLMKYGDYESTSGKTDAVKLSKIPDSLSSMKGMDLNCTPSADFSDNQFSTPTSSISHLNLPEGGERELCKTVLLDCTPSPDSAVKSGKSTRDSHFEWPGSDSKILRTNSCINMSCINEEAFSPGHSKVTTLVDRDLEAPVSPENKERSPPRGDSLEKTIGKSNQLSEIDHMNDHTGKTDRAAAEALVFISSSVVQGHTKTAKGGPSETSHDTLGWLAGIATSLASKPEKEVGEITNLHYHRNCNEVVKSSTRKGGKQREAKRSRARRSRLRRANYQKVLQTEVHPTGASVSQHQLNGYLLAVGGLESPANAASESSPCRKTPRRASLRSRRWYPIARRTACTLLQPHPSNDKQGISERYLEGWGLTKERQNSRGPRSITSFS